MKTKIRDIMHHFAYDLVVDKNVVVKFVQIKFSASDTLPKMLVWL